MQKPTEILKGNFFLLRKEDSGKFIQGLTEKAGLYEIALDISNVKKGYNWSMLVNQIHNGPPKPASRIVIESSIPQYTTHNVIVSHTNGQTVAYYEKTHFINGNAIDILSYSPISYVLDGKTIETLRPYATQVNIICTDVVSYNNSSNVILTIEIEYYTNPLS